MTEYTPGPWRAVEQHRGWWTVLNGAWDISHNRASEPNVVADARYSAMTAAENAANARLIAAAPDLLEAAKDALESLTECGPHRSEGLDCEACGESIAALRAAIAKAEGVE